MLYKKALICPRASRNETSVYDSGNFAFFDSSVRSGALATRDGRISRVIQVRSVPFTLL